MPLILNIAAQLIIYSSGLRPGGIYFHAIFNAVCSHHDLHFAADRQLERRSDTQFVFCGFHGHDDRAAGIDLLDYFISIGAGNLVPFECDRFVEALIVAEQEPGVEIHSADLCGCGWLARRCRCCGAGLHYRARNTGDQYNQRRTGSKKSFCNFHI